MSIVIVNRKSIQCTTTKRMHTIQVVLLGMPFLSPDHVKALKESTDANPVVSSFFHLPADSSNKRHHFLFASADASTFTKQHVSYKVTVNLLSWKSSVFTHSIYNYNIYSHYYSQNVLQWLHDK